jgi:hypothetical protein
MPSQVTRVPPELCAVLDHRHRPYQGQRPDAIHNPALFIGGDYVQLYISLPGACR